MQPFTLAADFDKRKTRLLGNISAVGELSAIKPLDDIQQAFTGPMVDQNGNFVYYEIMMGPHEVSYTCENRLYSIDGQIKFSPKTVDLPAGADTQNASGAFEVKLAWKILDKGDDPTRYLSMPAVVAGGERQTGRPRRLTSGSSECTSPTKAIVRHSGSGRLSNR